MKNELIDALANMVDKAIRKSSFSTYEEWLDAIGDIVEQHSEPTKERTWTVDGYNNFCRVFELPDNYPSGFCLGRGQATTFMMKDWFNPVPFIAMFSVPRDRLPSHIEIKTKKVDISWVEKEIVPFLRGKIYFDSTRDYLVICDFGLVFTFNAEGVNVQKDGG